VGGRYFNDLLPLPYTEEALRHFCRRVTQAQEFLGRRILIENPSTYLQFAESSIPEAEFLREAARTRALWLLISGLFIGTLANGAVSFHLVAYYSDKGMSSAVAAVAISVYALFGAIANFVWGFLVERMSERLLLAAAMVLSSLSLGLMLPVQHAAPAIAVAAVYGMAARGEGTLVNTILAQYYGRDSYGRIAGVVSPFNSLALGIGPLLASICFDLSGSYTIAFALFSGTYLFSAFILVLARKPARPAA